MNRYDSLVDEVVQTRSSKAACNKSRAVQASKGIELAPPAFKLSCIRVNAATHKAHIIEISIPSVGAAICTRIARGGPPGISHRLDRICIRIEQWRAALKVSARKGYYPPERVRQSPAAPLGSGLAADSVAERSSANPATIWAWIDFIDNPLKVKSVAFRLPELGCRARYPLFLTKFYLLLVRLFIEDGGQSDVACWRC